MRLGNIGRCVSAVLLTASCLASAQAETMPGPIEAAVSGANRSEAHRARDVYRKPAGVLKFMRVEPQHSVVEIWPGGGWYTEILAPLLKDEGKLYAAHFPKPTSNAYFTKSRAKFEKKLAAQPEFYSAVTVTSLAPPEAADVSAGHEVDRVLTFRNVHNWMGSGTANLAFESFYWALKPGGLLGVVEHRAKPGTSLQQMKDSGYVTEQQVIDYATAAGFTLLESSELLANPADSKDYEKGVWTLPPNLAMGDKDREKYLAIGESDRMLLLFEKPL